MHARFENAEARTVERIARRALEENLPKDVDGEAAGDLTAFVTTHAVGDDDQPTAKLKFGIAFGLGVAVIILVIFAPTANIGEIGQLDSRTNLHRCMASVPPIMERLELESDFSEADNVIIF